jgi:curved DNA-binding protein CbpA
MIRMSQHCRIPLPRLSFAKLLLLCLIVLVAAKEDLYKILNVKKTATTKEIKTAYRRKALDTHPDKNKDVPPETAAEEFHKVVHAFEILSDEASRRRYDQTGRTDQNSGGGGGGGQGFQGFQGFNFNFRSGPRKVQKLKDRFDVQEAQSRVMHIVSLEQLRTIMLDENDLLERNLLMVFVNPEQEKIADNEVVFPWPFAAKSTQGIWWEDLLQTVKVRYHSKNEITELFGIPSGKDLDAPIFVFGKRGSKMEDAIQWNRIKAKTHDEFNRWMWTQIEVSIKFTNKHPHPVEIYWIHETRAHIKETLESNKTTRMTSMLTHEWWIRDARTDTRPDSPGRHKLTANCNLVSWKIMKDEDGQEFVIEPKTCYDLSGHCPFWDRQRECTKNPNFMKEVCLKTCGWCKEEDDIEKDEAGDEL